LKTSLADQPLRATKCTRPHLGWCGFLTKAPNAIVEPIYPKAMPVILATNEERDV
jgi:putative SOS response-associated peptidase YedK